MYIKNPIGQEYSIRLNTADLTEIIIQALTPECKTSTGKKPSSRSKKKKTPRFLGSPPTPPKKIGGKKRQGTPTTDSIGDMDVIKSNVPQKAGASDSLKDDAVGVGVCQLHCGLVPVGVNRSLVGPHRAAVVGTHLKVKGHHDVSSNALQCHWDQT